MRRSRAVDLICVDSVSALNPRAEIEIGVYYGNPEVTSGGIALKFFASVRLEIHPTGKIKAAKGDEDIGVRVRVRVQKSKVSSPYKQAEFEIVFGEEVGRLGCILDCAEALDVVVKKGSWYCYGDRRLGQGRERALQYLRDNPALNEQIEKGARCMKHEGIGSMGSPKQDDHMFEEIQ